VRARFNVNPALAFACGDELKDYAAAVGCGIHPFIVSYGFEDFARLTVRHGIPEEVISRSPAELGARIVHTLGLGAADAEARSEASPWPGAWSACTDDEHPSADQHYAQHPHQGDLLAEQESENHRQGEPQAF
jgi:hypothetical protein